MSSILIIDDDHMIRMYLKTMLSEIGPHNFHEASDATKAMEMIEQHHPEFVLLDINLPDKDGRGLWGERIYC